ncbi:hypothetical protein CR079_27410, partial [Salmonella enterica subsp. enterica serovar Typhimurium]
MPDPFTTATYSGLSVDDVYPSEGSQYEVEALLGNAPSSVRLSRLALADGVGDVDDGDAPASGILADGVE